MGQRKLKTLPLKRKLDLIREVENNPLKKRKDIADEFNIPSNTLSTIMRDSEKYKRQYFTSETDVTKKRVRQAAHDKTDKALLDWFANARSANSPVSGPLLKQKAEEFSQNEKIVTIVGYPDLERDMQLFTKQ
ncbi:hypothetical protein ACOMHN_050348 [Nucella lapillus]